MHNCNQMTETMTDLLFAEKNQGLPEAIKKCPRCAAEYAALSETLDIFDQATTMAVPAPQYWAGYEAQLRTKLAAANATQASRQMWSNLGFASLRLGWLMPLLLVVSGLAFASFWNWRDSAPASFAHTNQGKTTLSPRADDNGAVPVNYNIDTPQPRRKPNNGRAEKPTRKEGSRAPSKKPFSVFDPYPLAVEYEAPPTVSPFEAAQNLEKAQMLLRGFRNVKPADDGVTFDVADEKSRSRALLQSITRLRRGAEATGNLPLEDALSSLEPVLLDIANLPARAPAEDVMAIKDLMQRNEIVGLLQNYLQSFGATNAIAD